MNQIFGLKYLIRRKYSTRKKYPILRKVLRPIKHFKQEVLSTGKILDFAKKYFEQSSHLKREVLWTKKYFPRKKKEAAEIFKSISTNETLDTGHVILHMQFYRNYYDPFINKYWSEGLVALLCKVLIFSVDVKCDKWL